MKKVKNIVPRKVLCILLSALLLFGMLPFATSAASTDVWVSDGKLTVIAFCGTITVEETGETFEGYVRAYKGTALTITLDETTFPDNTFSLWNGDDGTAVPQKAFRLLVERNTAFYPTFSDLEGNFGDWRLYITGELCTDGDIYIREDSATGLKEYKYVQKWHEYGSSTSVNGQQHSLTCIKCGYTELSDHYWNSGNVTTEPTHTSEGVTTYTCYDCGAKRYEAIAKTEEHSYGAWETVTEAKDGNAGLRRRTCACGDVQECYYIKAEFEQYFNDRYIFLDATNTKYSSGTRDEWHYAYKTSEGYDAHISSVKRDTGDTTTYAFMFIDDPTADKKPVYVCRSAGTSNGELSYGSIGYNWSVFHYVADRDAYFSLMANMSAVIHSVTTPDGGSMQLFYVMRQWENIYNEQNAESEDWWQDSYTRTETTYNGFDCWVYHYNNSSEKTYYVIKDSNVCIYSRDYSSGVVKDVSMKEVVYDADTSDMTEEELADWSSTHLKAEEIGSVKNLTFSKEKPQTVSGYRIEVVHDGDPDEYSPATSWSTRYEWLGWGDSDDRYRFSIVGVGQGALEEYEDSFTKYMFRLQPVESDICYFDHWELYNPETGEYEFYSSAETVDLNYITVTKDSNGIIISRSDHRIGDVMRFRGIYKPKTYHVKVTGGTFAFDGGEELTEADVPVNKTITLSCDYDAIPEGYGFNYFTDQNDQIFYPGNPITLTGNTEYTANYFEYESSDTTYGVYANAENGSVLMYGKYFYYGDFAPGTELTLTTEGDEGYDTFLGWYRIDWGKGKALEYILLSTETTLVYTVPEDYSELVAKWSSGEAEGYHDIIAADNGYCFIRSEYEGLAVSAVRIGETGEIIIEKDPTVTYKLFNAWHLTGTNDDGTAFKTEEEVYDYGSWFFVEETFPTVITAAGEITLCEDGGHIMDGGEIVVEPTYVKNGVMRYTCTVCGYHSDEAVPPLERYCVHACSVCGGCTLASSDGACGYDRCTCIEKAELTLKDIQPISFKFNGAEKNIKPQILNVAYEDDTENPYVGFVLKALEGHKIETIYDISLTDGEDKEYTLADGETFTVTLDIGSDNAQAVIDGRMYLAHITDNGNELYGLGNKAFSADVEAGTLSFDADGCSPFVLVSNTVEYYGRAALSELSNAEALLYAYDKIAEGVEVSAAEISVYDGTNPITQAELETVFDAYCCDHTEHFWLGNGYEILFTESTATALKPEYIMAGNGLETAKAAFSAAAADLLAGITSDMSEYEREKEVHDRLAAAISYGETENAHNAYGALVGGEAVCEGYAKAYQYLLRLAGLQSFTVKGTAVNPETGSAENHAWNIVRIDGEYYNVDLTWDDQGELISYAYFNRTEADITEDHTLAATGYALPECTAEAADYFNINGGELPAFDLEAVAELLINGEGTARVYVTGSTSEFITAFAGSIAELAQKLGLKGNIISGYTLLGRELILTVYSTGFTVSGTVTSFGNEADEITVQLIKSGAEEAAYQAVVKGNSVDYAIENVTAGSYTLRLIKNGHVTESSDITVSDSAVVFNETLYLRGDINTDGLCNAADLILLRRLLLGTDTIADTSRYDVREDGTVNIMDLVRFKKQVAQD